MDRNYQYIIIPMYTWVQINNNNLKFSRYLEVGSNCRVYIIKCHIWHIYIYIYMQLLIFTLIDSI